MHAYNDFTNAYVGTVMVGGPEGQEVRALRVFVNACRDCGGRVAGGLGGGAHWTCAWMCMHACQRRTRGLQECVSKAVEETWK